MANWCYVYTSLSGFLTVHPDLVFTISLPFTIVPFANEPLIFSHLLLLIATVLYCYLCFSSSFWLLLVCSLYWLLWMFSLEACVLIYAIGFWLELLTTSVSGSAPALACFIDWYCKYLSAVIVVSLMCHLLHVMHLPLVVSCIVYDLSWWLWLPVPTTVPWVHSPLSSCWTTTADTTGIHVNTGEVLLLFFCCLPINFLWWSSSQSCVIGLQSKTGMMLWTCLLNRNVTGLGKPWPNSVVWICSRAIFMSLPQLEYVFKCVLYEFDTGHYFDGDILTKLPALHWLTYRIAGTYLKQNWCLCWILFFGVYHIQQILF